MTTLSPKHLKILIFPLYVKETKKLEESKGQCLDAIKFQNLSLCIRRNNETWKSCLVKNEKVTPNQF